MAPWVTEMIVSGSRSRSVSPARTASGVAAPSSSTPKSSSSANGLSLTEAMVTLTVAVRDAVPSLMV